MLEAAIDGLLQLFQGPRLAFLVLGVLLGFVVGMIPGLGGLVGLSVLLPFIYGLDPVSGIALMVGLAAVTQTGDMFPAVLLGVPGSSSSQATVMDGYPLARSGQAKRALGAGLTASMVGGIIGAAMLVGLILIARPVVLALGSPELFMLTLVGLSFVGVLSGRYWRRGVLSAAMGLLLGSIGGAPGSPVYRFTFDQIYLFDGLPLAVVAIALFAIPEILVLVRDNASVSRLGKEVSSVFDGIRDAWTHIGLVARSSIIGSWVGFLPGLGGSVVDWITYGIAKQSARDSSKFGSGDIRGVIAPEAAANAKEGGALIPTLLFGIPGSGTTAVMLGGFLLLGIQVGPAMVTTNLSLTFVIVWSLALANILATALGLLATGTMSRLTVMPGRQLYGVIVIILVIAAFQSRRSTADVALLFGLGILGVMMQHASWPRPPLLIGFVLANPMERYLHISISRYGFEWLARPVVLSLGMVILLILTLNRDRDAGPVRRLSTRLTRLKRVA